MGRIEVLTEERLEALSRRFREMRVRELTHASFAAYVRDPDHYDHLAVVMACRIRSRKG